MDSELPHIPLQGERVAFARKRAHMTQVELAQLLGVTTRTIQNYESGVFPIHAEYVPILEQLAKLPPGWIVYDGPSMHWDFEGHHWTENGEASPRLVVKVAGLLLMLLALAGPAWGAGTKAIYDAPCRGCVSFVPGRQSKYRLATAPRRRTAPRGRRRDYGSRVSQLQEDP